jgi:hypothetical protein
MTLAPLSQIWGMGSVTFIAKQQPDNQSRYIISSIMVRSEPIVKRCKTLRAYNILIVKAWEFGAEKPSPDTSRRIPYVKG